MSLRKGLFCKPLEFKDFNKVEALAILEASRICCGTFSDNLTVESDFPNSISQDSHNGKALSKFLYILRGD